MPAIKNTYPLGFPWKTQDPFLFCVYHRDLFPKGNENQAPHPDLLKGRMIGQDFTIKDGWRMYHGQQIPGFPQHPHRGFETITVVPEGLVDHSDSMGATGRFGHGDVQWMTAGRGVLHAEMFPLVNKDKENPLLLFQLWLNLPKRSKFVAPHYKMLWSEDIPTFEGKSSHVKIIAGNFGSMNALSTTPESWASDPENEVAVWLIKIEKGGTLTLPTASECVNRSLYLYKGKEVSINNAKLSIDHGADLDASIETVLKNSSDEEAGMLLLQGKPINEPVVQQGPFVMNTQEEIRQAIMDYQKTQFGGWPWPKNEFVHPRDKGRFALHSDGREEIK